MSHLALSQPAPEADAVTPSDDRVRARREFPALWDQMKQSARQLLRVGPKLADGPTPKQPSHSRFGIVRDNPRDTTRQGCSDLLHLLLHLVSLAANEARNGRCCRG